MFFKESAKYVDVGCCRGITRGGALRTNNIQSQGNIALAKKIFNAIVYVITVSKFKPGLI